MEKALRYAIFVGLFGILFIPFIVSGNFFFPFITGKAFTFRIVVEIIFALWLILALRDPSVRPRRSALLVAFGAFLVSLGISTVLSENPHKSFWSNFERMEGYITLLHLGGYLLVVSSMFQTKKLWRRFWNTSIGVSVLVGLFGVFQLAGVFTINQGGVRVDATFGNASYLAVYMLFHFFITLIALSSWKPQKHVQVLYGVALVLQALMVFYTATRGSILGLVGGLFLAGLIFLVFAKEQKTLRKIGAAVAAVVLIVSGGFFAIKDSNFVQSSPVLERIASISLEEGETRFTIWGMAWHGFLERPVFGWGQESFNYVFNKYYEPSLYAQEPWFDRAHNIFLDWLVAGGVFGLLLYLSLFVITLWYLWRPKNNFSLTERALFTGLLAAYGFHNLFVFDNLMSYVLFIALLAYIAFRNAEERELPNIGGEKRLSQGVSSATSVGIAVFALVVLYVANVPGITRASGLIDAIRPYEEGITRNYAEFQEVISSKGLGRQEAHEQLLQFATRIRGADVASATTQEFKDEVALYSRDRFLEEIERAPNDARLRIFYSSFLRQIGLYDEALVQVEKAQELTPRKQSVFLERGALALDQGDAEGALASFKQAYELEPEYERARVFYAATAIRAGARDIADAVLIEHYGTVNVGDPFILQAYLDVGEVARVVSIAEARVGADPQNIDFHLELAAAYLEAGRRQDAINSIQQAIEINPAFKEQGDIFIQEIRAGRI